MIPGRLLTFFLAHWPAFAAVAVIGGGMWYLDHRGYERATADAAARETKDALDAEQRTRRIEKALGDGLTGIDSKLGARFDNLRVLRQTIVQPMQKEIIREARYSSPDCALTDGVFGKINAARSASAITGPDGSVTVALPPGPTAP